LDFSTLDNSQLSLLQNKKVKRQNMSLKRQFSTT